MYRPVNVKAQGLLNGAAYVREKHGEEALARVLAACSPAVRDHVATSIAISWIPYEELAELLGAADRTLGKGDGKLAEAIGAWSARANLRHLALRLAFFLARPEFLMRRVASVWKQFNDRGEMHVREFGGGHMIAELTGIPRPNWPVCCSVTGWLHEAGVATGMKALVTEHVECRARGGARCVWRLRWSGGA
jgi:predicted hydrocarbon binding protein